MPAGVHSVTSGGRRSRVISLTATSLSSFSTCGLRPCRCCFFDRIFDATQKRKTVRRIRTDYTAEGNSLSECRSLMLYNPTNSYCVLFSESDFFDVGGGGGAQGREPERGGGVQDD